MCDVLNVSVVDRDIMRKDEEVKRGGGCGGRMEVDVSEANSRVGCGTMDGRAGVDGAMDGRAGVDKAMDGCAGVDGAMDGRAGDKKGSGCVGCEVKYGCVNWAGNGNMGVGRIGR